MIPLLLAALGGLTISDAWSRPAVDSAVVYATIVNRARTPAVLVGASTPAALSAELHESTRMAGGTMAGMAMGAESMHAVPRLTIAPGQTVALKPGGYHLMLLGLRHPLAAGEHVPVTLRFAGGARRTVVVTVENRAF